MVKLAPLGRFLRKELAPGAPILQLSASATQSFEISNVDAPLHVPAISAEESQPIVPGALEASEKTERRIDCRVLSLTDMPEFT